MAQKYTRKAFNSLGNLGLYPLNSNVADPHMRFFYFKTLLSDYDRNGNEEYRQKANDIGNAALQSLTTGPFGNSQKDRDLQSVERLKNALKIVNKGIEYEQKNEKQYIRQRLNKLKEITKFSKTKSEDLEQIEKNLLILESNEDGIDYKLLIDTINIAMQGRKNAQTIYNYEYNRLKEELPKKLLDSEKKFMGQINNYITSRKDMTEEQQINQFNKSQKKFQDIRTETYLRNHTFDIKNARSSIQKILKEKMKDTKTIDVIMGEKITNFLNEIFSNPNKQEEILNIINKNNLKVNNFSKSEKEIKAKIITLISEFGDNNVKEILNEIIDTKNIVQSFEQEIERKGQQEYQIQINGLYENFGQYGRQLDFFKEETKNIENRQKSAKGLYEALADFSSNLNKEIKKKKVAGLDEETLIVRKKLGLQKNGEYEQIIKFIRTLERFLKKIQRSKNPTQIPDLILPGIGAEKSITLSVREQNGEIIVNGLEKLKNTSIGAKLGIKNAKTLKSAISTLKRHASEQLKNTLINIIEEEQNLIMREQLIKQLSNKLQNIRINIGGPTRNEITGAIQQAMTDNTIWSGKLNIKNDVISISIDVPKLFNLKFDNLIVPISNKINYKINEIMSEMTKRYGEEYVKIIQNNMKDINKDKDYTNYRRLSENFFEALKKWRETYENITEEFKKSREELNELITQEGINKKEIEKIFTQQENFLKDLQNTIYVSSTMKTFNNYQNDIGFVGGNIGANAAAQISNLNYLFEQAGMGFSKEEIDWLTFAVINNSRESVIGLKNENLIETILGSLAIFAMFDEGGAELQILSDKIEQGIKKMGTRKIMHLYLLNGIYYPGSYILNTIQNNLLKMLELIEKEVEDRSAMHLSIRLTNTVNMGDLPNRTIKGVESPFNSHPWQTVSKIANEKSRIHITFLAGLLDILKQLKTEENNIILPS